MKRLLPLALAISVVVAIVAAGGGQITAMQDSASSIKAASRPATPPTIDSARLARDRTEYARKAKALSATDVKGRYELALWCRDRGLLAEARAELAAVLKLQPKHEAADRLLKTIPKGHSTTRPANGPEKFWMGQRDILRIRLAELRSTDKVRIAFNNNVLDRYVELAKLDVAAAKAFRGRTPVEMAIEILVTRPDDRKLLGDIHVMSNPAFMSSFKLRVWPLLQTSCASMQCHGAKKGAGRLKLLNTTTAKDAFYYANFYILDSYRGKSGRLINRDAPGKSLLLEFGLPRPADTEKIARAIHPKPMGAEHTPFLHKKTPAYRVIDGWIRGLYHPRANYEVDYVAPCRSANGVKKPPATQPGRTTTPSP